MSYSLTLTQEHWGPATRFPENALSASIRIVVPSVKYSSTQISSANAVGRASDL